MEDHGRRAAGGEDQAASRRGHVPEDTIPGRSESGQRAVESSRGDLMGAGEVASHNFGTA
jgi:hypothetical protein